MIGYWERANKAPLMVAEIKESKVVFSYGEEKEIKTDGLFGQRYINHQGKKYYLTKLITETAAVSNYDIFEDRVKSLLERWKNHQTRFPQTLSKDLIRCCLDEINDAYTAKLME